MRGVFGDTAPIKDVDSWLNQQGIANILSMPELKKLGFHISYDSNDDFWTVSKDGVSIKF